MSSTKPYVTNLGLGGWWYVVFTDAKGVERHLPVEGKPFGRWTTKNCMRVQRSHRNDAYRVHASEHPDHAKLLSEFVKKYPSVEAYLRSLNKAREREKSKCG